MKYLLILLSLLLFSCTQTQVINEKVYTKRFEVNKIDERTFEIYY
jgi:hypothetical protein